MLPNLQIFQSHLHILYCISCILDTFTGGSAEPKIFLFVRHVQPKSWGGVGENEWAVVTAGISGEPAIRRSLYKNKCKQTKTLNFQRA